jgi:D-amino peptidase
MTQDAILSHVWDVREVKFNGKSLSETGLDASLAGFYGIPLVAISGDEVGILAIKSEVSDKIASAVVKKGMGRYSAACLSPKRTQRLIREAVVDGINRRKEIPPLEFFNPVTVDIIHHNHFNAYAHKFFVGEDERVSTIHTQFIAENAKEAYYGFLARDKLSKARHN